MKKIGCEGRKRVKIGRSRERFSPPRNKRTFPAAVPRGTLRQPAAFFFVAEPPAAFRRGESAGEDPMSFFLASPYRGRIKAASFIGSAHGQGIGIASSIHHPPRRKLAELPLREWPGPRGCPEESFSLRSCVLRLQVLRLPNKSCVSPRLDYNSAGVHTGMAELVDAPDLGSGTARRAGSSPVPGTFRRTHARQAREAPGDPGFFPSLTLLPLSAPGSCAGPGRRGSRPPGPF